ncbi:MAG: hydroxysqualene dehydroxylase HpnE [Acidobacteriota bacterium]
MAKRVIIIGGGFAGLAAGVRLSERGFEVVIVERRNHLGGRAYSFRDPTTGDIVDNGQHLFMGCYHHTIAFLKKLGTLEKLKFQERTRVDFLDAKNGLDSFACPKLPAPLHVLAGLFKLKGLTIGDKLRAFNLSSTLRGKATTNGALTVAEWLKKLKQSANISKRFWTPLVVATLNESPDVASAKMLIKVLQEAFGGGRAASAIGISSVGLSDLYTQDAKHFIESRGGKIQVLARAHKILIRDDQVVGVELTGGEIINADYVISAVPPNVLFEMLDDDLREKHFAYLAKLKSSAIVSINLWFDRPLTDRQFIGLIGTETQWLFNKDAIALTTKPSNHLALIISAANQYTNWTKHQLVEMAMRDLQALIPQSHEAKLLHATIVKEREATIAHTVESDRLRPDAQTPIANFFLAGDWTNTGFPATIESAVLSGNTAAQLIV